jgi:hypothetical protein
MNVWRWLGLSLFLLGALCFVSSTRFDAVAAVQDKGKDKDKDTGKDKDKDKAGKDKDKDKDKDKGTKDKDKDKDKGKEIAQPIKGGEDLKFMAFDPKGKEFFTEQTTETEQTMTVQGQKVIQKQKQTFVIKWTPKDKAGDNFVVEQRIVGVDMKIDIGGNTISYDSRQKNPKNPMTDFFEALMKPDAVLTFKIKPDLTVDSIDGRDKFVNNLININPQMQGLLKAILSDEALKKMAEPTWWAFPPGGKLPAKDGTWTRDSVLNLGPIGTYTTKFTFTNKSATGGKDTIGVKTKLEYAAPQEKTGLPFTIQKADLKSDNGEGEAVFDRTKGRFDSSKIKMTLTGKITIEVGNMTTDVDLNQTQNSSSITRDDLPADWKSASGGKQ